MKYIDKARLLAALSNPAKQKHYRRQGYIRRGYTYKDGCGATAIQPFIDLGYTTWAKGFDFNKNGWPTAENVTDWVERTFYTELITDWQDIRKGDLIKCLDRNGNQRTDHIYWALSDPDAKGYVLCLDNQTKLGRTPYLRALNGRDGKTAMLYGIRLLERV